jgi:hypothetical protein
MTPDEKLMAGLWGGFALMAIAGTFWAMSFWCWVTSDAMSLPRFFWTAALLLTGAVFSFGLAGTVSEVLIYLTWGGDDGDE